MSPPCSPRAADEFAGDIALVEPVVGRVDRFLAGLARRQGLALGLDELSERRGEVGLAEDLPRPGRFVRLAEVRQQDVP